MRSLYHEYLETKLLLSEVLLNDYANFYQDS
jgi:hypothetical protein